MPKRRDIRKILIIGAGPVIIGQAGEYDLFGTQACNALRDLGYKVVVVHSNPATVMTDPDTAESTYIEPLDVATIEKIIDQEKPDAILPNFGGQTGLNLCLQLSQEGILEKYGIRILGIDIDAIKRSEDRKYFNETVQHLGFETPNGEVAASLEASEEILERIDLPCSIRSSFSLAGTGGGLVYNLEEFRAVVSRALSASFLGQVLIEESVEGWEELEIEVVRDAKGQKITVCSIENIDAMGIHTGDSVCVAPMLTVDPGLQKKLEEYAFALVDALGIIGCANIQFAHNPENDRILFIEITPRLSRSSALASKATGFPVGYVSSLLAVGLTLDEIPGYEGRMLNAYKPPEGHVAVKFPCWAFNKFPGAKDQLGAQMQSVGEVLGIGRSYKEALQKSIRSMESNRIGPGFVKDFHLKSLEELLSLLWRPTSHRIFIMYEALRKGADIEDLHEKTRMKPWFIRQMKELVDFETVIRSDKGSILSNAHLHEAKKHGFSDSYIAKLIDIPEDNIRSRRSELGLIPAWNSIAVPGLENASYFYSTYNTDDQIPADNRKKINLLGSGPNRIGQGVKFDYCCAEAASALQKLGYEVIYINCNPSSVSIDTSFSDRLYFAPIAAEEILDIYEREKPEGILVQFGGEKALDICRELKSAGLPILGSASDTLFFPKSQEHFNAVMRNLNIPHPASAAAYSPDEARMLASKFGYPVMMRFTEPLGAGRIVIAHDMDDLNTAIESTGNALSDHPALIYAFLENALKVEANAISDGTGTYIPPIIEHIELTGVHSGDSACVLPSVSIPPVQLRMIEEYTRKIARELQVVGMIHIQFAIVDGTIYVLGVTPRASRTVPLVSKVCNLPLVQIAAQVMTGVKLEDIEIPHMDFEHYGVKEAVFPFNMFPEVDPVLGPEMRSTGEVLGIANSFELAFYKSQESAQERLPKDGTVLISVIDSDKKEALEAAKEFERIGLNILATAGTGRFLTDNGVRSNSILKISEGRPNIIDAIMNGEIHLIINTPLGKRGTNDDSYLRKAAIKYKIAYITTMAAAKAAAKGIAAFKREDSKVVPLQQYHSVK